MVRSGLLAGALSLALLPLLPGTGAIAAQSGARALATACAQSGGAGVADACADGALAAHALMGGLGLLSAAGGAIPVSPSTVGHRIQGSPRFIVDGGLGFVSFRHPDLNAAPGSGLLARRSNLASGRLTATVGIFDGFSPAATVGGVGSVDGVASIRIHRIPSSPGLSSTATALSAGVRLGIFRESFSLPGVTLTMMHHRLGRVRYGDMASSGARVNVEPRVNSLRLEVGKDMLALGVTGGVAWDRISGDARVSASWEGAQGESGTRRIREDRRYLFAGLNYTWLVTQIAGEVAWAPGRTPSNPLRGSGSFEAGGGGLQGALTFRIIH
ncbi:MAG: hypothetical protein WD960_02240 [Gemmatimonadota bacterium]